jgi:DNA-directed RNA polymerase specialized sigma24 family protein
MDQKTFDIVASARIAEFTEGVPRPLRREFVQDMWVHLLEHQVRQLFDAKDSETGSLGGYLNLILFRARANWLSRHKTRSRVETMDPVEIDEMPSLDRPSQAHDAEIALQKLREVLSTSFGETDIDLIIAQLEEGTPLADIARRLGKSPQAFHYYIKKTREAA